MFVGWVWYRESCSPLKQTRLSFIAPRNGSLPPEIREDEHLPSTSMSVTQRPFFFVEREKLIKNFQWSAITKFDQWLRGKCSWNPFCLYIYFLADTWCFLSSTVCDKVFFDTVLYRNSADIPIDLFLRTPNRIIKIGFGRRAFGINPERGKFPQKQSVFRQVAETFLTMKLNQGLLGGCSFHPSCH